jgi:hypothetical protein
MPRWLEGAIAVLGTVPAALALAVGTGLALHREAAPVALVASLLLVVLGPPMLAAGLVPRRRGLAWGTVAAAWGAVLFLAVPVYFPGERAEALVTGLSMGSADAEGVARTVVGALPPEPTLAEPAAPEAETLVAQPLPPPGETLAAHEIALPYEGDGRRMSVEIAVEHEGTIRELQLLLDTGATYTTLPGWLLREMGVTFRDDDPVLTMHTAGGTREARVVLVDRVWLGDLPMDGVAVARCDPCEGEDTVGLLGLNVTGGYNLSIDADRREVIFSRREDYSRHLDIKPFVDVQAFLRRRGERVRVRASLENRSARTIEAARAAIHCRDETWLVDIGPVDGETTGENTLRLPEHDPCERYQVSLHSARW